MYIHIPKRQIITYYIRCTCIEPSLSDYIEPPCGKKTTVSTVLVSTLVVIYSSSFPAKRDTNNTIFGWVGDYIYR